MCPGGYHAGLWEHHLEGGEFAGGGGGAVLYNLSMSSLEVILRAEAVEKVQAGDKCDFIGTLIVVPDVAQLRAEGKVVPPKG